MSKAVFAGTFDPFTLGHQEIVERGLQLFHEIVIGIGINADKKTLFDLDTRMAQIQKIFAHEKRITVQAYHGLTIFFARDIGAGSVLRGLRNSIDFEYERTIALANQHQVPEIETVFLVAQPQYSFISSTVVREMIKHKGSLQGLVSPLLEQELRA